MLTSLFESYTAKKYLHFYDEFSDSIQLELSVHEGAYMLLRSQNILKPFCWA